MSTASEYWRECISQSAESCGLVLTKDQLNCLSDDVEYSHDNYVQAFYSPPSVDIEKSVSEKYKKQIEDLEKKLERYSESAETAVKRALKIYSGDAISIEEDGGVFLYGGRIERLL